MIRPIGNGVARVALPASLAGRWPGDGWKNIGLVVANGPAQRVLEGWLMGAPARLPGDDDADYDQDHDEGDDRVDHHCTGIELPEPELEVVGETDGTAVGKVVGAKVVGVVVDADDGNHVLSATQLTRVTPGWYMLTRVTPGRYMQEHPRKA